ncbi:MAG: flagellar basal-body rod protein FlgF [Hyphomicrobiales bacterium]|nr:MAG: flagellar basal-body rod protein FlgF [Hyphomicrobiales bacterium]
MENAQLIGLSRQLVLRRQMDVLANNVANINTNGFKGQKLGFEEYMMPVARANSFQPSNTRLSFVHDFGSSYDFAAGATVQTGNPLDVALNGDGWFAIETPQGERYTRNGSLGINANGELVDQAGKRVLGEGGPITFTSSDSDIAIAADGTVSTNNGVRGRIRIVEFADNDVLEAAGDNLFKGDNPQAATAARVVQGSLEKSNVSGVVEITRLIDITRAYESIAKMQKETDDLRQQAISDLGRLEA